jgi:hypothetical protein
LYSRLSGVGLFKITSRQQFSVVNIVFLISTRVKVGEIYMLNAVCCSVQN